MQQVQAAQILTALWTLGPWLWLILAVVLFVLETIVPGVHFLWFGLAAIVVGVLTLLTGIDLSLQLIVFAVVAVATVFGIRRSVTPESTRSDVPDLNARGAQYVGRRVVVEDAIHNGRGRVRVDDTLWSAQGADAAKGTEVQVTGVNGTVLLVAVAQATE